MSKIQVQTPIIHTPSFNMSVVHSSIIKNSLTNLGLTLPMSLLDGWYYYTDAEGWGKLLVDLMIKSNLYQSDKFDCDDYALKAKTICSERYGLNTMAFVIGDIPEGRHAFNMIYAGEGWLIFEANEGFQYQGQAFPIGENGYRPELILV